MSLNYNFSYSTLADIYAVAEEEPKYEKELIELAKDLERHGYGSFEGTDYMMNPDSRYPDEIISIDDYKSQLADKLDDSGFFDYIDLATSCGK